MSKLTIQLIILVTLVVGWVIFMLCVHYKHKKRMNQIEEEWAERRRRWQLEEHGSWLESQVPTDWVRRSAMVPYDEVVKTDKLSPPKKMGKHTMR